MNFLIPNAYAHDLATGHADGSILQTYPLFFYNAPGTTLLGTLMAAALAMTFAIAVFLFVRQYRRHKAGRKKMSVIQILGWFYAVNFYAIVAMVYIPGFTDDAGNLLGVFKLDLIDDILHLGSAIWATLASAHSTKQTIRYFKIFGIIYALDGLSGLILGHAYLNLALLLAGPSERSFLITLAANTPHIIIGSVAFFTGFVLSKKKSFTEPFHSRKWI